MRHELGWMSGVLVWSLLGCGDTGGDTGGDASSSLNDAVVPSPPGADASGAGGDPVRPDAGASPADAATVPDAASAPDAATVPDAASAPDAATAADAGGDLCAGSSCDDRDPCTADACENGACAHVALADDAPCSSGGAAGTCAAGVCRPLRCPEHTWLFDTAYEATPEITLDGLTISAQTGVAVGGVGVGVVGGASDTELEDGETVDLAFEVPVTLVELTQRSGPVGRDASFELAGADPQGREVPVLAQVPGRQRENVGERTEAYIFPEPVTRVAVTARFGSAGLSAVRAETASFSMVDFTHMGLCEMGTPECAVTQPSLTSNGVTVTARGGDLYILPLNGIGITGGTSELTIDGGETLVLTFDEHYDRMLLRFGLQEAAAHPVASVYDDADMLLSSASGNEEVSDQWMRVEAATRVEIEGDTTPAYVGGWRLGALVLSRCERP